MEMEVRHLLINVIMFLRFGLAFDTNSSKKDLTLDGANSLQLIVSEPELFWTFNESADVSKYENFDHSKFIETELNIHQPIVAIPTAVPKKQSTSSFYRNKISTTNKRVKNADSDLTSSQPLPSFDNNIVTNITAQQGSIALLPCHVRNLGDRSVTWIRRRDWHIITSGILTYTTDDRYQVIHKEDSDSWDLQIKYAAKRDNGTYECQVPHAKGKISQLYNLFVIVPSAYILGNDEYHVGVGSTINLVCVIENSPIPPQYVLWYHNDRMMNYETSRQGVTVTTDPGLRTHSRLIINNATPKDSGNYSCRSSNAEPDTTYVYVSHEGDNTAAIQKHDSSSIIIFPFLPLFFVIEFVISFETVY